MTKKTVSRRDFVKATALGGGAIVLAACAAPATPEAAAPAATAAPVKKAIPASAQGQLPVPRDETFVVSNAGPFVVFDSFNPYIPSGAESTDSGNQLMYEPLWYLDPTATDPAKVYVPGLAETWAYENDYQKLTVKLRKGVTWNDGKPFTSADVAFTIGLLMGNEKLIGFKTWSDQVDKVETPDDLTFVLTLKKPYPRFHYIFVAIESGSFQVLAKHIWEGEDPTTFKNWPPVTTGPYKLYQSYPELKMFVYERNEDYWGKDAGFFPAPKYFAAMQGQSGAQTLLDLQAGAIDFTGLVDLPVFEPSMPYDPMLGYTVMKGNNGPHGFHLNCAVAPLDNAEFRWALSYLVNYPKFAEVISAPPVLYNNGVFNSTDVHAKYRNKDILAKYPQEYNPEKAKEILEKLGYKAREDGKRLMPDGKPIFLEAYSYYSSGHQKTEFLLDLASEAGKVGIDVAVRMAQQPAAEAAVFVGNYSIYVRNVTGPGPSIDPFNLYNWLRKTDNPLGEKTSFNWNRWDNPKSDELLKELSAINPDDPKAMPLYDGLLEEFMKGMPSIPLVETAFARMWTKRYWDNIPTNDNYYAEPHSWGLRWHLVGPKLVPGPGFE